MVWKHVQSRLAPLLRSVNERLTGKKLVGTDLSGNKYYLHRKDSKHQVVHRSVEYANSDVKPETVPISAHQWLRLAREAFPTHEEMRAEREKAIELQNKVKEINEADARLRLQEIAERRMGGQQSYEVDLSTEGLIKQLELHHELQKQQQKQQQTQREQ